MKKILISAAMLLSAMLPMAAQGEASALQGEMTYPSKKPVTMLDYVEISFSEYVTMEGDAPAVTCVKDAMECPVAVSLTSGQKTSIMKIDFGQEIEEPGTFVITVPEGVVTNGEVTNAKMVFPVVVTPYAQNYEVTPTDRATVTVSDLKEVRITFPDMGSLTVFSEYWKAPTVRIVDYGVSSVEKSLVLDKDIYTDGNAIVIALEDIQQLEYQFTIPAADFITGTGYVNPPLYLYYNVWEGMAEATILEAPMEDGYTTPDVKILMTWDYQSIMPTDKFVVKVETGYVDPIPVAEENISLIYIDNGNDDGNDEVNALYIDLSEALTEYLASSPYTNSVVVTIPEGILENKEGKINAEKIFRFNVYEASPNRIACEETQEPGIYNIFWGDNITWMSPINYGCEVTLTAKDGTEYILAQGEGDTPAPGCIVSSYLDKAAKEGICLSFNMEGMPQDIYRLNVPGGLVRFNLDGAWAPDYTNPVAYLSLRYGDGGFSGNMIENVDISLIDKTLIISANNAEKIAFTNPQYVVIYGAPVATADINVSVEGGEAVSVTSEIICKEGEYYIEANLSDILPVLAPGDETNCRVDLPEGLFMNMQGDINPSMVGVLDYSSVETIRNVTTTGTSDIYNLQGIKVGEYENMDNLPAGIYIINGKKVMKRSE